MKVSNRMKTAAGLAILGLAVLCVGFRATRSVSARTSSPQDPDSGNKEVAIDEYQRSAQVFYMQRFAKTGAERGGEIYYMKCWVCHNDYTVKADPNGAPTLRDLYKRPQLLNGQPVNDETVGKQVRDGSAKMPAFGHTLSNQDISDLVAYLQDKCYWDEMKPPANPRYRYQRSQ